jgi:hypothetical protein
VFFVKTSDARCREGIAFLRDEDPSCDVGYGSPAASENSQHNCDDACATQSPAVAKSKGSTDAANHSMGERPQHMACGL